MHKIIRFFYDLGKRLFIITAIYFFIVWVINYSIESWIKEKIQWHPFNVYGLSFIILLASLLIYSYGKQEGIKEGKLKDSYYDPGAKDPLFNRATGLIKGYDKVSASFFQRKLTIGYARAARLLDQLETEGIVGSAKGSAPRKVLKK